MTAPARRIVMPLALLSGWRGWAGLAGGALAAALVLTLVGFPAAPLLGAMIIGIVFGTSGSILRVPRPAYILAQGAAGVFIATTLTPAIFVDVIRDWPLLLCVTALTLATAFAIGWSLHRWVGIDRDAAIYGSLPGMSGAMVIIATERGVDARIVALMQYVRLAAVIFVVAAAAHFLPTDPTLLGQAPRPVTVWSQALALACTCLALPAAAWLRFLPAAGMLAPMILVAGIEASGLSHLDIPAPVLFLTFMIIGLEVGLKFTAQILRHVVRLLPSVMLGTLALILFSACIALLLQALTGLDFKTAFLAVAPGSMETVALDAVASQSNVAAVMAFQAVRLFAVVLIGPGLMGLLARLPIWRPTPPIKKEQKG